MAYASKETKREYNKQYYLRNKARLDAAANQWAADNREHKAEVSAVYRSKNKDKIAKRMKNYYPEYSTKNKERIKAKNQAWYEKNREYVLDRTKVYAQNNPAKRRAAWAKYKASKLRQTPIWADLKAIQNYYAACPAGYHVDHIVPLQGKDVRGFHVLENLQYLSASENCSKGNRF